MRATFVAGGIAAVMLAAAVGAGNTHKNVKIHSAHGRDAYAIVLGGRWMTTNQSIEEMNRLLDDFRGDVLWFRRNGMTYVVRDAGKLQEAKAYFDALRTLEPEQTDLAHHQQALERKEEALDRERDGLEDRNDGEDDEDADREPSVDRARDQQIRELDTAQREIQSEIRGLDEEERVLDRRNDELEKQAETKLWAAIDGWIADGSAKKP